MQLSLFYILALAGPALADSTCRKTTLTMRVPCGCDSHYVTQYLPAGEPCLATPTVVSTIAPSGVQAGTIVVETPLASRPATCAPVMSTEPAATSEAASSEAPSPTESTGASSTTSEAPAETSQELGTTNPFGDCAIWRVKGQDLYTIDLVTGEEENLNYVFEDVDGDVNALAYNTLDGYIYGTTNGDTPVIVVYGENGYFVEDKNTIPNAIAGEIDEDGQYWLLDADGMYYQLDTKDVDNVGKTVDSGSAPPPDGYTVEDWAIVYGDDGGTDYLWGVGNSDSGAALLRFSRDSHEWEVAKDLGDVAGDNKFGSVWGSGDGYLWATEDSTGRTFRFDTTSDDYTMKEAGTASSADTTADGTRCPRAKGPALDGDN